MTAFNDWTLITGTGRSGTSCFARLLHECFPDRHMPGTHFWWEERNAGYEGSIKADLLVTSEAECLLPPGSILKDPRPEFFAVLPKIDRLPSFVFVCFRPLHLSAKSRFDNEMKYFGSLQHSLGVDYQSGIIQGMEGELKGTNKLQYLNDHVAIGMIMKTIWMHDVPHAILKYPDFVTDAETLYEQVNAALPVSRKLFMAKHAEIMDPGLVHIK